ncbi:hypothetical protein L1965_09945 [Paracoccus sp. EGI L200073]|nr:hypothetical protein [Paracoccus salsus]
MALVGMGVFPGTAQAACEAPGSWTSHDAVPAPDNTAIPQTNCDFHVWSWNTFLWMTQPDADGDLRFENFATLEELFDPAPENQAFSALSLDKSLVLSPRSIKPAHPTAPAATVKGVDGINQAGSLGVLVRRSSNDPESGRAVYYSLSVDPVYYDFIRTNKYYDVATYLGAPADKNFDVGAAEFKYSWMVVEDGEDVSDFFTVDAQIVELTTDSTGKVVPDPTRMIPATVALVGVHVVGVVQNHPEFIWATFEHKSNAPDLPQGMDPTSDDGVSDQDWTFYAAGTPAKDSNLIDSATNLKFADQSAQTLQPVVDVFRQFAWGTDMSAPDGAENAANIQSLNQSVLSGTLAGDAVWSNYRLTGAVWGDGTLTPNTPVTPIGSTKLSNSTLETFTQGGANCFSCHGPYSNKNMNISHIMLQHSQAD